MTLDDLRHRTQTSAAGRRCPSSARCVVAAASRSLVAGYWFDWQDQLEQIEAGRAKEAQLRTTFLDKKKQAINLEAYRKQLRRHREVVRRAAQAAAEQVARWTRC